MPKYLHGNKEIFSENENLRAQLKESKETLLAIRTGKIDSLVVSGVSGEQIYTLVGADHSYRLLIENMNDGALILNNEGVILYCNRRFAAIIKMPLEKVIGSLIYAWIAPQCKMQLQGLIRKVRHGKCKEEILIEDSQESLVPVYLSLHKQMVTKSTEHTFLVMTDLTEINLQKKAEERLTLEASVFTHAREGIIITDPNGKIIDINDSFIRITGYRRDEVLGRTPHFLCSDRNSKVFLASFWRKLTKTHHWEGEMWCERKHGEEFPVLFNISSLHDSNGSIRQFMGLLSDITTIKEHQKELEHMAHYDALTNLPNRVLLADRLQLGMHQMQRRAQYLGVVFLDLDQFKNINDTYGHETGDQLLISLAASMKQALREGDTLCRLGGDEFIAVLLDLEDGSFQACEPTIARLLGAVGHPTQIGGHLIQVSASLGITFYPQAEEVGADQLLRQADQAMYQAKQAGKNRYHVFDADVDRCMRGHHESIERIERALIKNEFVMYFQPKVNMRTGEVIGAEALIRWQHPERGLLNPQSFLPVIEDHPLIVTIGEWVIDTALTQIKLWRAAGLLMHVSVNISARQLQHSDFVSRLHGLLALHSEVSPGDLELELLETSALEDLIWVSNVIDQCRKLGLLFTLDDFGTGYSSLTYLKRLPVSQIKIDQSFVRNMISDPDDLSILEGIIGLASAFHRTVIAEGVETVEHGTLLLQLGCELAQGFGIARPMPAHEMQQWCKTWFPDPAWVGLGPVNGKELPLVLARVEHSFIVRMLSNEITAEGASTHSINHRHCHFGRWLHAEGRAFFSSTPAFETVNQLHCQFHDMAAELFELHSQGLNLEVKKRLHVFKSTFDAMLEKLKILEVEIK